MRDREAPPPPAAAAGRGERQEGLRRLLERIARGQAEALGDLYRDCADELYGLALWRTASPADAADVVQEVFVKLARSRTRLSSVRDPLSYLHRMAHAASVDLHRQRGRRPEQPLQEHELLEAPVASPERTLEARRVSRLLLELPPAQREAIYLRHYTGCSFAEIGRATSVPTFTAASRYRLGMKRLRQSMGVKS